MGSGWQAPCETVCADLGAGREGCFPAGLARAEHIPAPPTALAMEGTGRQAQCLQEIWARWILTLLFGSCPSIVQRNTHLLVSSRPF